MLWYKGWLETRLKVLFSFGFIAFFLYSVHTANSGYAPLSIFIHGVTPVFVGLLPAMLFAGAGIATQPPFQATKGLHGSTLFTLSLPVSRLRLLAVRASLGWFEMAGYIVLLCCSIWITSAPLRSQIPPVEMVEYTATLIACSSVFYCFSVLLATFLEDQWRSVGTMLSIFGLWTLSHQPWMPVWADIFHVMGGGSPLVTHAMPWAAALSALAVALAMLVAALSIVQARDY